MGQNKKKSGGRAWKEEEIDQRAWVRSKHSSFEEQQGSSATTVQCARVGVVRNEFRVIAEEKSSLKFN